MLVALSYHITIIVAAVCLSVCPHTCKFLGVLDSPKIYGILNNQHWDRCLDYNCH
jgi:hypothetical protein